MSVRITKQYLDEMVDGYIDALLRTSNTLEDDECLDEYFYSDDLDEESRALVVRDCREFLKLAGPRLNDNVEPGQVGHDFLLTRNRHGAGFWDRPHMYAGRDNADKLTEFAQMFGEQHAFGNFDDDMNPTSVTVF